MRRAPASGSTALLLALALAAPSASAQTPSPSTPSPTASVGGSAPSPALRAELRRITQGPEGRHLPPADDITIGSRSIAAGARVTGPVAVAEGDLDVYGRVNGDVAAIDGNVIVHDGAAVTGNAIAIGGTVRVDGGSVDGEIRQMNHAAAMAAPTPVLSPFQATLRAIEIVLAWLAVLFVLGIGVLIFAEPNLDGVTETLQERPARAFWIGVLGELAMLPVLAVLCVVLAVTVIGIIAVPLAIVAYVLAVAGLLAIGFLATARVTGAALPRGSVTHARSARLRALTGGILLYIAVWAVAALFTWAPIVGAVLRMIAVAITWVALTAGFGAALMSRAGTRLEEEAEAPRPAPRASEQLAWATPTPITGVAAARRPTPAPPTGGLS